MSFRNITIGQIAVSASLIFIGIAIITVLPQITRLADNAEQLAPAANSIGAFLAPSERPSIPREVPIDGASRTKKVQDMTTIEVVNMAEPTEAQLAKIARLEALNFTTQAIWNDKNKVLFTAETELERRTNIAAEQQNAINNPTEDQDPDKLRRGMHTIRLGVEKQRAVTDALRSELSTLQSTLDDRTRRIEQIVGQE